MDKGVGAGLHHIVPLVIYCSCVVHVVIVRMLGWGLSLVNADGEDKSESAAA